MVMLVTLEEAKAQINQDIDVADDLIVLHIEAASAAVLSYLKSYDFVDSDGELVESDMPRQVKAATLILFGILFKDRDGESAKDWEPGYLPKPVTALLYPLRDPALA